MNETILLIGAFLLLFVLLAISFIWASFGLMFLFGAPWVRTPNNITREFLTFADLKPGQTITDLGSGDASILICALKDFGAKRAIGYELNPLLNLVARLRAKWHGVSDRLELHTANIFHASFEPTDLITTYLLEGTMDSLLPHLQKNLPSSSKIASRGFAFTNLTPIQTKFTPKRRYYLYEL